MLNLSVAVLLYNFENNRKNVLDLAITKNIRHHKKQKLNIWTQMHYIEESNIWRYKRKYPLIKEINKTSVLDGLKELGKSLKITWITNPKPVSEYHKKHKIAYCCYYWYHQPITRFVIYFSIIVNSVTLALDQVDMPEWEYTIIEYINWFLVLWFTIELLLKWSSDGLFSFFCASSNWWDWIVVLASIADIAVENRSGGNKSESYLRNWFRVWRLLRIFKLLRSWGYFRMITESIKSTVIRWVDFLLWFCIILYMFALLGFSWFADSLRFDPDTALYKATSKSNRYNFDGFIDSVVSVFIIIIGEHWQDLFYQCYRSEKNSKAAVIIYFITLVLIGQITMMNIFWAYLIDNFDKSCTHLEKNVHVKNMLKNSELELTKIYEEEMSNEDGCERKYKLTSVFNYFLNKFRQKRLEQFGKMIWIAKRRMDFMTKQCYKIPVHKRKDKSDKLKELDIGAEFPTKKTIKQMNQKVNNMDFYCFKGNYSKPAEFRKKRKVVKGKTKKKWSRKRRLRGRRHTLIGVEESVKRFLQEEIECINQRLLFEPPVNDAVNKSFVEEKPIFEQGEKEIKIAEFLKKNKRVDSPNKGQDGNLLDEVWGKTEKMFKKRGSLISNGFFRRRKSVLNLKPNNNPLMIVPNRTDPILKKREREIVWWEDKASCTQQFIDHWKHSSWFIFHKDWPIRKLIRKWINRPEFSYIIFALIMANIIVLCFDNPWVNPNSSVKYCLYFFNLVFNIIFLWEGVWKIIADDFIFRSKTELNLSLSVEGSEIFDDISNEIKTPNKKQTFEQMSEQDKKKVIQDAITQVSKRTAYLLNPINIIDFFCIIIGCLDMIGWLDNVRYLRVWRAIRSVKPIRLLTKSENLNLIIKCLIKSIPAMGNVFFICFLYLYLFSIVGLNLMKSKLLFFCDVNSEYTEDECRSKNGNWVEYPHNYKDFWYSLRTNFEIMMTEGWTSIMGVAGSRMNTKWIYIWYIGCIVIGNLLILNWIVSVLIQKFKLIKKSTINFNSWTTPEKDWMKLQQIMMKFKPVLLKRKTQGKTYKQTLGKIINSEYFEGMIMALILLSTITWVIQYDGASEVYTNILEGFNYFFTACFNAEILMKLLVNGLLYFRNSWNIFDFVIVMLCNVMVILNALTFAKIIDTQSLTTLPVIFRLFKIFRIFRIISTFGILRAWVDTLVIMIPSVANVSVIISIVLVIYANVGMNLFGTVPYREYIHRNNHFRNFVSSTILLFQATTGEDWPMMMNEVAYHDCKDPASEEYKLDYYCAHFAPIVCYNESWVDYESMSKGERFSCGNNFSYAYFISFIIIGPVLWLNLCVVMVVEGFSDSMTESQSILTEDYMNKFISLWMEYDVEARRIVKPHEFVLILKELQAPFGLNYDRWIISNPWNKKKFHNQYRLYHEYMQKEKIVEASDVVLADDIFINKNLNSLPYAYNYRYFYMSKNKKFYTDDIEILQIWNKFEITAIEDKSIKKLEPQSFSFSEREMSQSFIPYATDYYISFVDACIAISRLAIAKSQSVAFDKLRLSLVNSYSMGLWWDHYTNNELRQIFAGNDEFFKKKLAAKWGQKALYKVESLYLNKYHKLKLRYQKRRLSKNSRTTKQTTINNNYSRMDSLESSRGILQKGMRRSFGPNSHVTTMRNSYRANQAPSQNTNTWASRGVTEYDNRAVTNWSNY